MCFRGVGLQIKHLVSCVSLVHSELILYHAVMDMENMPKWPLVLLENQTGFFQLL